MCGGRPFALLFSHHAGICICGEFLSCEIATGRGARAQKKGEGTDEDISKGKRSAAAQKTLQTEKEKRNPPSPDGFRAGKNHPRSHGPFQGTEGGGRAKPPSTTLGSEKKSLPMDRGKGGRGIWSNNVLYPPPPLLSSPPFSLPHTLFPLDAGRIRIRGDCPSLHQSTPPRQEGGRKNIPSAVCRGNNFRRDIPGGGKGGRREKKEGGKEGVAFA